MSLYFNYACRKIFFILEVLEKIKIFFWGLPPSLDTKKYAISICPDVGVL